LSCGSAGKEISGIVETVRTNSIIRNPHDQRVQAGHGWNADEAARENKPQRTQRAQRTDL
jgi:hypothetical protein